MKHYNFSVCFNLNSNFIEFNIVSFCLHVVATHNSTLWITPLLVNVARQDKGGINCPSLHMPPSFLHGSCTTVVFGCLCTTQVTN